MSTSFFIELKEYKMYSYFMQDNAMAHTENYSNSCTRADIWQMTHNLCIVASYINRFKSVTLLWRTLKKES